MPRWGEAWPHLKGLRHFSSLGNGWLFRDPMDCSPPGSSVHGSFEARMLEWVAFSFSRGSSQPRDWTHNSWMGRGILYCSATWEAPSRGRKLQKSSTKHLKKPSFFGPTAFITRRLKVTLLVWNSYFAKNNYTLLWQKSSWKSENERKFHPH